MRHYGGFESTKIHGSGQDILATTNHLQRWEHDLELLRVAGIHHLRYSAPWHRIEATPGYFDFSWMDGPMGHMRNCGMNPILDLLHHVSFPDWLENGLAHPDFPAIFVRFAEQVIQRYPWVNEYTIVNEPLATTILCSYRGIWYPYQRSDQAFVDMALNVGRAICLTDQMIRVHYPHVRSIYVETCEYHQALDSQSKNWAEFANLRRFLIQDLVLGHISKDYRLLAYLQRNGFGTKHMHWFSDRPVKIDVLGLNYYPHSEMDWYWNPTKARPDIYWKVSSPQGFNRLAVVYANRYGVPILLSETNCRGTVGERITWLRFMEEQCEEYLARGGILEGFCWYPSIDSTDWNSLCTICNGVVDPQGIWCLDDSRWARIESELSRYYSKLASGLLKARDLRAYRISPTNHPHLSGYLKLISSGNWHDTP